MKLFSNFTLKILAIIFMVMDHIYTYLSIRDIINIPIWFGYLGKIAAPIFFYMIVEGFFHTRSRKKYMIRLFGMGALMIFIDLYLGIQNNIFLSLGAGVAFMTSVEYIKSKKKGSKEFYYGIILAILCAILSLGTEASIYGLMMILIFYFLRQKKIVMSLAYIFCSLVFLAGNIGPDFYETTFLWDYQWMMVLAIIPILLYNGKRGISNKFIKWMFYWFYPIHLIIIITIKHLIVAA